MFLNKRIFKISGISFLFISLILTLNSSQNFTGFIIFENSDLQFSFYLSVWFFLSGIFLIFISTNDAWNRYRIDLVEREYERGAIGPVQAALKINELYGNSTRIRGVKYHGGNRNLTIITPNSEVPLRAGDEKKARDLALGIYEVAVYNDPRNAENCELHLSRSASTKHHKKGFKEVLDSFESSHKKELSSIG